MKEGIILVVSKKMDKNAETNRRRNEHKLIRLGRKARENLGLMEDKVVELWSDDDPKNKANRSKVLHIYQAYSADLKEVKKNMPKEEYLRVGFVTSQTFRYLCSDRHVDKADNIWLADSVEEILVGADPEFALLDSDKFIYAAHVEGLSFNGELASDGPLAELRPNPEIDVDKFISNIKNILTNNNRLEYINGYRWYAHPYYNAEGEENYVYGIGGHIHVGTPKLALHELENDKPVQYSMFGILNYILNHFIAIPFMYIEGVDDSVKRRVKSGYGIGRYFRTDRERLEYRVLSGAWLKHPTIAKAVVGTAKAIAESYYKYVVDMSPKKAFKEAFNFNENFNKLRAKINNLAVAKEFAMFISADEIDDILRGEAELPRNELKEILKCLKKLPTYNKYSEYIDLFIELVKYSLNDGLKASPYFKTAWRQNKKLRYVEE